MDTKSWFQSKMVWLGIVQTAIAILSLVAEFLTHNDFSSAAVVMLFSGALTIVLRIWFTNTGINK